MRRALVLAAVMALALARPELYKEKEDFQYSRSSSDEGTKAGFYGAQRGNMGGNYERAHNMDLLAQHQMGGLVRTVHGEVGDKANERSGSVFTSANTRGMYGSGQYDLSNLDGRNFQEGTSYSDTQSQAYLASHNSGYRDQAYSAANSASSGHSVGQNSRHRGYNAIGNTDQALYNTQALDNLQATNQYDTSHTAHNSGYYSQAGYNSQTAFDQAAANSHLSNGYGSQSQLRVITPARVYIRPGGRVAIPVAAQTYDASQGTSSSFNQNAINSETEALGRNDQQTVYRPTNNAKHYESSFSYRKEWEKHNTNPVVAEPLPTPTVDPYPTNSELYEDAQNAESENQQIAGGSAAQNVQASNQYTGYNVKSASSSQSSRQAAYNSQQQSALSSTGAESTAAGSSAYLHRAYNHGASANLNNQVEDFGSKPKSYQSSYSYHKSWERQGDPYIIKPSTNGLYTNADVQSSQRLTDSSLIQGSNGYGSHQYHAHNYHGQQAYLNNGQVDCDENGHVRVARSYYLSQTEVPYQQNQNIYEEQGHSGQQPQNLLDLNEQSQNLEDFSQISQNPENLGQQSQNLEDLGQQPQNLEDLGQQSQNLEDLSQQSQNLENFGQQFQNIENLGQQSQNLENFGQQSENFGQQSQNIENLGQESQNLENFGQQSQNIENLGQQSQNLENFGQQSENFGQQPQRLEDFGQQSQNLEDLGQHTQNQWSQQQVGQQTQNQWDQQSQTDLGQQTQNTWTLLETLQNENKGQDQHGNEPGHKAYNFDTNQTSIAPLESEMHRIQENSEQNPLGHVIFAVPRPENDITEIKDSEADKISQFGTMGQPNPNPWNYQWNTDQRKLLPMIPLDQHRVPFHLNTQNLNINPGNYNQNDHVLGIPRDNKLNPWMLNPTYTNNANSYQHYGTGFSSNSYTNTYYSGQDHSTHTSTYYDSKPYYYNPDTNTSGSTSLNSLWDKLDNIEKQTTSTGEADVLSPKNLNQFNKEHDHNTYGSDSIQNGYSHNTEGSFLNPLFPVPSTTNKSNIETTTITQLLPAQDVERGDIGPENQPQSQEDTGRGDIGPEDANAKYKPLAIVESKPVRPYIKPYKTPEEIEALSLIKENNEPTSVSVLNTDGQVNIQNDQKQKDRELSVLSLNEQKREHHNEQIDNWQLQSGVHPTITTTAKSTFVHPKVNTEHGDEEVEKQNASKEIENSRQQTQYLEHLNFNQFETYDQQNVNSDQQNVEPEMVDFGQQSENLAQETQKFDNFGQQNVNYDQQAHQVFDFGQQSENIGQETQQIVDFGQQSENIGQETQQIVDFGQQSVHINSMKHEGENLGQQEAEPLLDDQHKSLDLPHKDDQLQNWNQNNENLEQRNEGAWRENMEVLYPQAPSLHGDLQQQTLQVETSVLPSTYPKEGRENSQQPQPSEPIFEPQMVTQKSTNVDASPETVTEKVGFWNKLGSKFVSAKDKVSSWFSSS